MEVDAYSKALNVSREKFYYIPYFFYDEPRSKRTDGNYILAIGRHRDFSCFVEAISVLKEKGVVVGGASDQDALLGLDSVPNVKFRFEVSKQEYDSYWNEASIVVIPLFKDEYQRSLGQIAILKAMTLRKPLIVADSPVIKNYVNDDVALFYKPGDVLDLRAKICELSGNQELQDKLTDRAAIFVKQFSRDNYIQSLAHWVDS
jgi:glycosyltransferase involved in cell wall biosynthesis